VCVKRIGKERTYPELPATSEMEMTMKTRNLIELIKDDNGATAIEYGLIAALVSVAGITALTAMGGGLQTMFTAVATELNNAVGTGTP